MLAGKQFPTVSKCVTWSRVIQKFKLFFPLGEVSFVLPGELVSFDPRHVTHSPPIEKCLQLQQKKMALSFVATQVLY